MVAANLPQATKILLADDEHDILMLVNFHLQRAGFQVILAENGREALDKARLESPSLAILDRMMPEIDGVEVCRQLREFSPGMYIILLTAMGSDSHRIDGMEAGADDYIVKPFNARELVLKVQAMLRPRPNGFANGNPISPLPGQLTALGKLKVSDDLTIDPERRQIWLNEMEIKLTKLEFDLLLYLTENPGLVFSRDKLLGKIWNYDYFGDERVVDVHMARLRKKLESDPAHPRHIQTIRGVGYKFMP